MNIVKKIMHSRFPYILGFVIIACGIWFMYGKAQQNNGLVNQDLIIIHRVRSHRVHVDQDKIFKYRTQLSAMSDQHMMYLLHHPKLKKHLQHAQYMKMTQSMMRINDTDSTRIANLQHDINVDRDRLRWEHPHKMSTNATRPQNLKPYGGLAQTCVAMIIMVILDLYFLVKIVRFKDDRMSKLQESEKIKAYQMMQKDQKNIDKSK